MSGFIQSAIIAGLLAVVFWFGFNIAFGGDNTTLTLLGAPVFFAIAFGIGFVVGKRASAKKAL